jgi:CspA family cold shock protein
MRKVVFATFSVLFVLALLSTPALAARTKGTVKWFNAAKGMDFITPADGTPDIFVPASALSGSCNGTLHEGQAVEFDIQVEPKMG